MRWTEINEASKPPFRMPIGEMLLDHHSVKIAMRDILAGKLSHSASQPVAMTVENDGLRLGDGYHRVVQAILLRRKALRAISDSRYATEFDLPPHRRWTPDWNSPTFGLETLGFTSADVERAITICKAQTHS